MPPGLGDRRRYRRQAAQHAATPAMPHQPTNAVGTLRRTDGPHETGYRKYASKARLAMLADVTTGSA